jgi:CheY-like chemotaxis protein
MKKLQSVLLIDDDFASNYLTRAIIQDMDITEEIYTTTNGEEALHFMKENCLSTDTSCPELILLDVNMPIMDGFEFLEELHKMETLKNEHTTIVMLTTSSNQRDTEKARKYKVACYLEKPLTEESIRTVLQYREL